MVLPKLIRDIVYGRRWWIPLLLAVLSHLPRHSHREQPLRPGEGPAHLPGQGAGLPPSHPAAGTQFNKPCLPPAFYTPHILNSPSGSIATLKAQNGSNPCLMILPSNLLWCESFGGFSKNWSRHRGGVSLPPCRPPLLTRSSRSSPPV